jgi:hypothetical protein
MKMNALGFALEARAKIEPREFRFFELIQNSVETSMQEIE